MVENQGDLTERGHVSPGTASLLRCNVVGPLYGEAAFSRKEKRCRPCYQGSGRNGSEPATTVVHWPVASGEAGIGHKRRSRPEKLPFLASEIGTLFSPIHCLVFYLDLTFVAFDSESGIHSLPSTDISNFAAVLMKSGANVIVPLMSYSFPPVNCFPEKGTAAPSMV